MPSCERDNAEDPRVVALDDVDVPEAVRAAVRFPGTTGLRDSLFVVVWDLSLFLVFFLPMM